MIVAAGLGGHAMLGDRGRERTVPIRALPAIVGPIAAPLINGDLDASTTRGLPPTATPGSPAPAAVAGPVASE